MAGNTIGNIFRVSSFGESHGQAIGAVIEGCPAGLEFDTALVSEMMLRRRPGVSLLTSNRQEGDEVVWLSGIFEGKTTGTAIGFIIPNKDAKSSDYEALRDVYRPSHADFGYEQKYGIRDHRGGGRASARETAARVAAGSVAMMLLRNLGISIKAAPIGIGPFEMAYPEWVEAIGRDLNDKHGFPDKILAANSEQYILDLKEKGDSTGGFVGCRIDACPPGWGEPVFSKLNAALAGAMMSIPAAKGVEFGMGFALSRMKGSQANDPWVLKDGRPQTDRNLAGGIIGGISTGENIHFKVAFKPTSSIAIPQKSLNSQHEEIEVTIKGRHDPCVVPRAVVVVEAMTALVLADFYLLQRNSQL
jgi:chorismate synthase